MNARETNFGSPEGEPSITTTRPMTQQMCEKLWTLPAETPRPTLSSSPAQRPRPPTTAVLKISKKLAAILSVLPGLLHRQC